MLLKYIKYNNIFRNHHDLEYHIKYDYQSSIKIKFQNENTTEIKRTKDNIFKYKYKILYYLHRQFFFK